jgi:hypothetical protein
MNEPSFENESPEAIRKRERKRKRERERDI